MPTEPGATAPALLISLSSFGAAEVRRHGQLYFAQLGFAAGADGVEVRSELLVDAPQELPALAAAARDAGKSLVYSCADYLWKADGSLDKTALEGAISAATTLGAPRMKFAIGGFNADSLKTLATLQSRLADGGVELVIENDQTPQAGTLSRLQDFFAAAQAHGQAPGMTFDMGNWHWNGECPLLAASALAGQVTYVHCKGVQRQPQRWVAVPLADSAAPWRAVLQALPADVPWAIEYPLIGDDLPAVTRRELDQLRAVALAQLARPLYS
jgi:sugar phosphate isomerase/epimerase